MDKGRERFGGSRWQDTIPTKPRSRSVPDVADTKFAVSLLAKQLIKCRRLPRGFFWNSILPALVFDCSCFRNEVGFFVCYEYFTLLFIVIMRCVFYRWEQTSGGKEVFQKKPLGRRWHLMSGAVTRREFSVHYVWNGAKARFRWNTSLLCEPFGKMFSSLFIYFIIWFFYVHIYRIIFGLV